MKVLVPVVSNACSHPFSIQFEKQEVMNESCESSSQLSLGEFASGQPDARSLFYTVTCRTGVFFSHFASKIYP